MIRDRLACVAAERIRHIGPPGEPHDAGHQLVDAARSTENRPLVRHGQVRSRQIGRAQRR